MSQSTDVLIIGGGIIGSAIAYYLSQEGAETVVIDQGTIGAQASSAAVGLIAPLRPFSKSDDPYTKLLLASLALFPDIANELESISGIDIEFQYTGTIREVSLAKLEATKKWLRTWATSDSLEVEWLSGAQACQREASLHVGLEAALYAPKEGQVNAVQYTRAFSEAARLKGATFLSNRAIVDVHHSQGRALSVSTMQGETILCGHIVIAAGAWSGICSEWLGCTLPIRPRRGQVLSLRPCNKSLQHILFANGIYLAPKRNGTILVGATSDEVGFDTSVTAEGLLWLLTKAIDAVPTLKQARVVGYWAGLRPKTPDSRPLLGIVPGWKNVTVATGHNGFGITLSAITGRMIAHDVLSGEVTEAIRSFGPSRFQLVGSQKQQEKMHPITTMLI